MKTRKLPKTDSIQKLAKFWDTHDSTDFDKGLVEVTETVFERVMPVEVRLQPDEAEAVRRMAQDQGVTEGQLIHDWVKQKLTRRNGRGTTKRRPAGRRGPATQK